MESSLKIKNNSSNWFYNQPVSIRVASPNTEEAMRQKTNDWYFRAQKQYEDVMAHGGSVWFPTLTFNDDNLPRFNLSHYLDAIPCIPHTQKALNNSLYNSECFVNVDPDNNIIPCFDVLLVRLFVKELRIFLERLGYDCTGMQYIICAEYGKYTQRPHYHALLFFYFDIPVAVLLSVLRRAWHYGFVGHGKKGLKVKSTHAMRYATKYVGKDMYFGKMQYFKGVGMSLNQVIYSQDAYEPKEFRKMLKRFMPYPTISHGFGKRFFDDYLSKLPENALIPLLTKEKTIALPLDKANQFTLPQYYINKFCYRIDKELTEHFDKTIAVLTPIGKKVTARKVSLRYDATLEKLGDIDFNTCSGFNLVKEYQLVRSIRKEDLAKYITYFRYLPYTGGDVTPEHVFQYSTELIWSMCFDRKENHYYIDKKLDDVWFTIRNLEVGGSVQEQMYDAEVECVRDLMPVVNKGFIPWCELDIWKKYERSAQAYDVIMNKLFEKNEHYKTYNREKKALEKYDCLTKTPSLVTNYESI